MDPTGDIKSAVKSGFTLKNMFLVLFGFLLGALILDFFGLTKWLIQPWTSAKEAWAASKAKTGALVAFFAPAALAVGSLIMGAFALGA